MRVPSRATSAGCWSVCSPTPPKWPLGLPLRESRLVDRSRPSPRSQRYECHRMPRGQRQSGGAPAPGGTFTSTCPIRTISCGPSAISLAFRRRRSTTMANQFTVGDRSTQPGPGCASGDGGVSGVYLLRGTSACPEIADLASDSYRASQCADHIDSEGRQGDAIDRFPALVSHSHGRAHTPALTPSYLPDQSGQGRPTVNLSGAPMTTHRNTNATFTALRLPVTGTATQRVRCHAQSTKVGPSIALGARA